MLGDTQLEIEYNLWILLNHTRHAIYRARELELSQYDITVEQARMLVVVDVLKEKALPTEIARHLFRESHTISSLIDRMENKELVVRVKDPFNKKIVKVRLTPKGQKVLSQVKNMSSLHTIMSGLSPRKQQQLKSCLEILMHRTMHYLDRDLTDIAKETLE